MKNTVQMQLQDNLFISKSVQFVYHHIENIL